MSKFEVITNIDNRPPSNWETQVLSSAGFRPEVISLYERAVIHGINYKRSDSNTKITRYCNEFVYCRHITEFAQIVQVVCFDHNNKVKHGLFVKLLKNLGTDFGARHFQNVQATSDTIFIDADDDVMVPAILIATPANCRAVKLSNIWETD